MTRNIQITLLLLSAAVPTILKAWQQRVMQLFMCSEHTFVHHQTNWTTHVSGTCIPKKGVSPTTYVVFPVSGKQRFRKGPEGSCGRTPFPQVPARQVNFSKRGQLHSTKKKFWGRCITSIVLTVLEAIMRRLHHEQVSGNGYRRNIIADKVRSSIFGMELMDWLKFAKKVRSISCNSSGIEVRSNLMSTFRRLTKEKILGVARKAPSPESFGMIKVDTLRNFGQYRASTECKEPISWGAPPSDSSFALA